MKDNSFSLAMNKIVGEHTAEMEREIRTQKRRVVMARVRKGLIFASITGMLVAAFCYHNKLETTVNTVKAKLFHSDNTTAQTQGNIEGKASAALAGARQNAATRDQLIDDLSKSK